jgi:hypothetical protein
MKRFNIGDTIFVYHYSNKSRYNDDPIPMKLDRNSLINHWRGTFLKQYFIIEREKIGYMGFGNYGSPFSTIVRIDEENAIIVSDSLTTARGRINAEYKRREKIWQKEIHLVIE